MIAELELIQRSGIRVRATALSNSPTLKPNATRRTHEYTVRADDEASAQRGCATIAEARRACELTRRGKAPSGGTRDGGRGSGAERCADASNRQRAQLTR